MKKEELNYYDMFISSMECAENCARIITEYIENFDSSKSEEIAKEVHKFENDADNNLHRIVDFLIKDFLPPIEREDIMKLSHSIDDLVDNVDEIAINIEIYEINKLRGEIRDFMVLIFEAVQNLKELLELFRNKKNYGKAREKVIAANIYEEKADDLYQSAIRSLYSSENNPIEVIKWTTIYNCLENCMDINETVANCIDEIIAKNN